MTQKKIRSNSIKIDGEKLKKLLETMSGRSLAEISVEHGFSRRFLPEACRVGVASAIVQSVARLYNIEPEDYRLEEIKEPQQMTIDEIVDNGRAITITIDAEKLTKCISEWIVNNSEFFTACLVEATKREKRENRYKGGF